MLSPAFHHGLGVDGFHDIRLAVLLICLVIVIWALIGLLRLQRKFRRDRNGG